MVFIYSLTIIIPLSKIVLQSMGSGWKPGIGEAWPVGMGFRPTDNELFNHHLKRKLHGLQEDCRVIPELDIYQLEPQALFEKYDEKSDLPSDGRECFFYCVRKGKNRKTRTGFWKETRKNHIVKGPDGKPIGSKKILVYYEGQQRNGRRSQFSMHEYHLNCHSKPKIKDPAMETVLCRVINRIKETNPDSPSSECIEPDPITPDSTITNQGDDPASPQVCAPLNLTETEVVMPNHDDDDAEMELQQVYNSLRDERDHDDQFQVDWSITVNYSDYNPDDDGLFFSELLKTPVS